MAQVSSLMPVEEQLSCSLESPRATEGAGGPQAAGRAGRQGDLPGAPWCCQMRVIFKSQ